MPKNDGGPAFPIRCSGGIGTDETYHYAGGMSLRDWFAGMALQGILLSKNTESLNQHIGMATKGAYLLADAMLKEREKGD